MELPPAAFEGGSHLLAMLIDEARITHDRNLIRRIRRCWQFDIFGRGSRRGERWKSILRKFDTEGSTWVVWWNDGVTHFLTNQRPS
jgi:hypothetical protein